MNKIGTFAYTIFVGILVLYIIFLQECRGTEYKDRIKTLSDSLELVKNIPPDTIVNIDTIIEKEVRYVHVSAPVPVDSTKEIKEYPDSLIVAGDDLRIYTKSLVKGTMLQNSIDYRFIPKTIIKETEVIKTVKETQVVSLPQNGFYINATIGTNIFGGGIDYISKKEYIYGIGYIRHGDKDLFGLRFGAKIKLKR